MSKSFQPGRPLGEGNWPSSTKEPIHAPDWKHLTLFLTDPATVAAFGMADCGLTPNLEADISQTGCAAWRPVAVCGTDHDLLKVEGEAMYFGVRPDDNDLCSPDKRPTTLLPAVMRQ